MKLSIKKLLATTFVLGAITLPAQAQDAEMQNFIDRLERMDRDIKALNLKVYRGTDPISAVTPVEGGEQVSGPLAARLSVRVNELESQIRQLTGQLEETAYRITQMNSRLDKLVADVDYRLTALEGGTPVARAPQAPDQAVAENPNSLQGETLAPPAVQQVSQLTLPASGEAPNRAQPQTGQTPGVLGTLSGSDLKNPALSTQPGPVSAPSTETAPVQTPDAATQLAALTPEQLYQESRQKLMKSQYGEAEGAFKSFLVQFKDHKLAGNARYWLGETYYVQGNYPQAAAVFLEGYQKSSSGAKAPDSLLKLGMSLSRMEKLKEACSAFGKLRADFPKMPAHLSKTLERERTNAKCQ